MAKRAGPNKSNLSPSKITDSVFAFREARVILTAYELDLFTIIGDGYKSSGEIARHAGTDGRATDRLLNALCASGYLHKKRGKFSNSPLAARYLVKGGPDYLGGLMHQASLWNTWSTLTDAVRVGSSVLSRGSIDKRDDDWLGSFIAAMHMRAKRQAPAVVDLIDLRGVRRVLDVGGGSGAFSTAFARANKNINAVVFDLPYVTPLTRNYIESEYPGGRISFVQGDYTTDSLGGGFDLVFMSAVIHSNSAATNRQLFGKAFEALNPGGRIVVLDFIMDDDRVSPAAGAYFSLNMLVGTAEGDTFTESEIRKWMKDSGFIRVRRIGTGFGTDLMIGKK